MPDWDKVSHISFSARDKDRCAAWFTRVMGFRHLEDVEGDGWRAVLLIHEPTATVIEFQQHDANKVSRSIPAVPASTTSGSRSPTATPSCGGRSTSRPSTSTTPPSPTASTGRS